MKESEEAAVREIDLTFFSEGGLGSFFLGGSFSFSFTSGSFSFGGGGAAGGADFGVDFIAILGVDDFGVDGGVGFGVTGVTVDFLGDCFVGVTISSFS